jgi:hypothetical protein
MFVGIIGVYKIWFFCDDLAFKGTNSAAFVDNRGNDNSFFVDSKLDYKDLKGVLFATISTILAD